MTVYAFSRLPAFNPNTNPASVAKSATGSVYDLGDTGFLTPLNLTLVATNTVTTTLISDANGMFPDFTLVDRTQCAFKSGTQVFILTTSTPIPGPASTVAGPTGPAGPATTDASLLTAGTVADARLPVTAQAATLSATYAKRGPTATTQTPADASGGGPGVSAAVVGVDLPARILGQGVGYNATSPFGPTITDGSGTPYTLANAYVAIPFTLPAGNTYIGTLMLAVTAASATPDQNTYLTASIYSDNAGVPGTNLTAGAATVPHLYADQLLVGGAPTPITTGNLPIPYFIRTNGLTPATKYWIVLRTSGVLSSLTVAQSAGAGVVTQTSADGTTWAAGSTLNVAYALYNASQPGTMGHSNGYVGHRGDSGSSGAGTLEGAGGYYGNYGTGGLAGVYGHSHGGYGTQGDSVKSDGVHGVSQIGNGLYGSSTNGIGVYGTSPGGGVVGETSGASTFPGVRGNSTNDNARGGWFDNSGAGEGVYGRNTNGTGYGVHSEGYFRLTYGWGFTAAAAAGLGTTPPALVTTGVDGVHGTITFGTGTAPAAGSLITFAFPAGRPCPNTPLVFIQPLNDATAQLRLIPVSVSTTGFTVSAGVAPAASQANTVYAFSFVVIA